MDPSLIMKGPTGSPIIQNAFFSHCGIYMYMNNWLFNFPCYIYFCSMVRYMYSYHEFKLRMLLSNLLVLLYYIDMGERIAGKQHFDH